MSREKIKVAALELFRRYSYVKTSVSDIASASGIGKGTIYLSFKTKEEILFSLLEDSIASTKEQTEPFFLDAGVKLDDKLDRLTHQLIDLYLQIRDLMFGSFENVQGRELHDVYSKLTIFFEGFVAQWVLILRMHGYQQPQDEMEHELRELMLFLTGRFLSYILSHEWNNTGEIRVLLPQRARKLFYAFLGKA